METLQDGGFTDARASMPKPAATATALPPQTLSKAAGFRASTADSGSLVRQSSVDPPGAASSRANRSEVAFDQDWRYALETLASPDEARAVDGMKMACAELSDVASGQCRPEMVARFVQDATHLVEILTQNSRLMFHSALTMVETSGVPPSSRACKYVLNTLMQVFQVPQLAKACQEATLCNLTCELLLRLLDDRVPQLEEGTALLKALNILMLKILENSQRNFSFSALLYLLRVPPAVLEDDTTATATALKSKFTDLVVKCLIKLTKTLGVSLGEMSLEQLLLSVHEFFLNLGVDEVRRRGQEDDRPLRMVKTVLHELCKHTGPAIREFMGLVPKGEGPDDYPIIYAYIDLNLQSLAQAGIVEPSSPMVKSNGTAPVAPTAQLQNRAPGIPQHTERRNPDSSTSQSPTMDLKQELAAIFKKIGDKDSTSAGLEELYHFTQTNPAIDITPHLSKTSEAFRIYIKRGLEKVEQAFNNGTAPAPSPITIRPIASSGDFQQGDLAAARQSTRAGSVGNLNALRDRMRTIQESVPKASASSRSGEHDKAAGVENAGAPSTSATTYAELKERMKRLHPSGEQRS